jgi:hypothetical protein
MKKLHYQKFNSDFLSIKTHFSKMVRIVITGWFITAASLIVNAQGSVKGGLGGLIRDSETQKPISGAIVKFINTANEEIQFVTLTDKGGYYRQEGLPPGIYIEQFSASGYQSKEKRSYVIATRSNEVLVPMYLEPATKSNVRQPANLFTGNLAVGSIPNAEITVMDLESGQIYKNKILSNELLCIFDRLPAKKYRISASLSGYKPQEKEIELKENQTLPLTLNLTPNETTSQILTQVGKYYALIIGNNDYKHLPKLKTAENDAKEVEAVLRKKFGFETKLLLNATREQIIVALNEYRKIGAEDNLIIYYAGHGQNDKEVGRAYWLPVDARTEDDANWISADDITTNVRRFNAKHVLIVSDSCYSGTISRGADLVLLNSKTTEREKYLLKMNDGKSRTLMASGGDEPVTDGGGGLYSVFAAALLIGLLEMEKDIFTAEELYFNHVKEKVAGKAEQIPEYNPLRNSGHEGGDFVFIRKK